MRCSRRRHGRCCSSIRKHPSRLLIAQAASKVGFAGGIVVDYPNSSKAKKYYLCLSFERSYKVPAPIGGEGALRTAGSVQVVAREKASNHDRRSRAIKAARPAVKSVQWVLAKKERRRQQDKPVKSDSKFSGRKRSTPF